MKICCCGFGHRDLFCNIKSELQEIIGTSQEELEKQIKNLEFTKDENDLSIDYRYITAEGQKILIWILKESKKIESITLINTVCSYK